MVHNPTSVRGPARAIKEARAGERSFFLKVYIRNNEFLLLAFWFTGDINDSPSVRRDVVLTDFIRVLREQDLSLMARREFNGYMVLGFSFPGYGKENKLFSILGESFCLKVAGQNERLQFTCFQ